MCVMLNLVFLYYCSYMERAVMISCFLSDNDNLSFLCQSCHGFVYFIDLFKQLFMLLTFLYYFSVFNCTRFWFYLYYFFFLIALELFCSSFARFMR